MQLALPVCMWSDAAFTNLLWDLFLLKDSSMQALNIFFKLLVISTILALAPCLLSCCCCPGQVCPSILLLGLAKSFILSTGELLSLATGQVSVPVVSFLLAPVYIFILELVIAL